MRRVASLRRIVLPTAALLAALVVSAPARADGPAQSQGNLAAAKPALIISGAGLFALSYGVSVFVAATQSGVTDVDHSHFSSLYVPVVGPFLALGSGQLRRDEKVTIPALGVTQTVGLGLAVAGIVIPGTSASKGGGVAVTPSGPLGSAGVSISGSL